MVVVSVVVVILVEVVVSVVVVRLVRVDVAVVVETLVEVVVSVAVVTDVSVTVVGGRDRGTRITVADKRTPATSIAAATYAKFLLPFGARFVYYVTNIRALRATYTFVPNSSCKGFLRDFHSRVEPWAARGAAEPLDDEWEERPTTLTSSSISPLNSPSRRSKVSPKVVSR